jgi:hypothetical protein
MLMFHLSMDQAISRFIVCRWDVTRLWPGFAVFVITDDVLAFYHLFGLFQPGLVLGAI